jgi:chitinase
VASGSYSVYLYVWEDNNAQAYSITVEGKTVESNYNSGAAGHWDRLGPFAADVTDGTISIGTTGGDANISGIEIWKQGGTTAATPPTVSLSAPGTGTVGAALSLTASAASASGSIAKVEFFNGSTKLGEDLTAPYALSFAPTAAGTLALTARATDNAGAATTSNTASVTVSASTTTPTTTPTTTAPTFLRAVNLAGPAITLDGYSWDAYTGAANFQATGIVPFANQNVNLNPATTSPRSTMIRSSVFGSQAGLAISNLASGTYSVYLYVWEDNNAETFSITLEGRTVQSNYNSGAAGHWDRLGPFTAAVTDGTINVGTTGGTANLSGIEIWKVPTSTL